MKADDEQAVFQLGASRLLFAGDGFMLQEQHNLTAATHPPDPDGLAPVVVSCNVFFQAQRNCI